MKLNWKPPRIKSHKGELVSKPDHSFRVHEGFEREDGTIAKGRPYMDTAVSDFEWNSEIKQSFQMKGNLESDIKEGFVELASQLHYEIQNQIASEKWEWDRPTGRRDGSVVTSPRDIIDSGELLKGQALYVDGEAVFE